MLDRRADKALTRRQKESMQVLMKALTDFVLEDGREAEDISSYEEAEEKPARKSTERRFYDSISEPDLPSRVPTPLYARRQERLVSTCNALIGESIKLEYSLRTLGAGGPGMYSAWVLRRSLRVFLEILESFNMENLYQDVGSSRLSERCLLERFIDELPGPLHALWKALDELDFFTQDFVSFFHSVALARILHSLKKSLAKQYHILQDHKSRTYISPVEGQILRQSLLSFFSALEESFEICSMELSDFRTQGVPLIRSSQQNQSDRYLMLTTISTFFSAVTSATLQIAFQDGSATENTLLATAVNTFFFSSLIFSTASAVQSLLAMAWQRSFIRLPEERWAFQWVRKGPLLSLVISGVFFATGLCLFVIASQKSSATTFFTVIFALLHAIGLITMSIWFLYEQWKFRRQSEAVGRKLTETSVTMSLLAWVIKVWRLRVLAPSRSLASRSSEIVNKWPRVMREKLRAEHGHMEESKDDSEPESVAIDLAIEPPSRPESVVSDLDHEEKVSPTFELSSIFEEYAFETQYRQSTVGGPVSSGITTARASGMRDQETVGFPSTEIVGMIVEQVSESAALEDIPGKFYGIEGDVHENPSRIEGAQSFPGQWASGPRESPHKSDFTQSLDENATSQAILNMGIVDEPMPLDYSRHSSGSYAQASSSSGALISRPDVQQALPISEANLLEVRKESWEQGLRQESISYMEMYNRRNPKRKRTYPPFEPPPA